MSVHKIICGHVIPALETLPDEYVDMLMTSVPYWGLRDYGEDTATIWGGDKDCEHDFLPSQTKHDNLRYRGDNSIVGNEKNEEADEIKIPEYTTNYFCSKCGAWHGQLGLEPTPELYIEHLRMVFAEVKRVLKKSGTCWVNIGDTYAGSGCGKNDYRNNNKRSGSNPMLYCDKDNPQLNTDLPAKCMCMIPERFAFMMVDLGYILRNKIIWHKPNPMPSSVKDRFNTTYEMLYFFSKSGKYWFDLDAVREPHTESGIERAKYKHSDWKGASGNSSWCQTKDNPSRKYLELNPSGKNPSDVIEVPSVRKKSWCANEGHEFTHTRKYAKDADGTDFWVINTQPFPEAHFAVFPEKLCEKPILAGCPAEVCKYCGMARVRITEPTEEYAKLLGYSWHNHKNDAEMGGGQQRAGQDLERQRKVNSFCKENKQKTKTIGWADCQCEGEDKYEPGIIIDPFAGSGTVGIVAEKLGRNSILIDIKKDYCEMALKRLKPLVEQTDLTGKQSTIERIGF